MLGVCCACGFKGLYVWQLSSGKRYDIVSSNTFESAPFTSMVQVQGDEYICFVASSFESPKDIVFGFPESERGLMNLRELAKRHLVLQMPPETTGSRKRKASKEQP